MDEDDFLAELEALSSSSTAKPVTNDTTSQSVSTNSTSESSKNIEDELFELLGSTATPVKNVPPKKTEASQPSASSATNSTPSDQDFLSWLEETPKKSASNDFSSSTPSVPIDEKPTSSTNLNQLPVSQANTSQTKLDNAPPSNVDAFLDDVFGVDTSPKTTPVKTVKNEPVKEDSAHTKSKQTFSSSISSSSTISSSSKEHSYESEIENILTSPFPDLGQLRLLIDSHGFIPIKYRVKVLVLLLTGSCLVDEEASSFTASTNDKNFFIDLIPDCEILLKNNGMNENKSIVEMISDVVYLYCQRRSVEYKNVYSRIMLSILGDLQNSENMKNLSKPLLSSCFYSIASSFLPLIGLQVRLFCCCLSFYLFLSAISLSLSLSLSVISLSLSLSLFLLFSFFSFSLFLFLLFDYCLSVSYLPL
jgi:hypothetical protein